MSVDELPPAGRRNAPPAAARDAVYAAAHAAWRRSHQQRVRTRHLSLAAALLLGAGVASLLWLTRTAPETATHYAARVETVTGRSELRADSGAAPTAAPLATGITLRNGDMIRTRPGSRVVLRRASGLHIHLGPDSEASWESQDELLLTRGVVYVETTGGGNDALVLVTHAGRIQHVGTRYGVEVAEQQVRVMVRDGAVRIADARGTRRLASGLEGRIDAQGDYTELPLAADAGPWSWMLDGPARFAIEDRPLREVLHEMSAAAGISLAWPSAEAARDAQQLVLHGPTLELPPRQALDAVLLTTRYTLRGAAGDDDGTPRFDVVAR